MAERSFASLAPLELEQPINPDVHCSRGSSCLSAAQPSPGTPGESETYGEFLADFSREP